MLTSTRPSFSNFEIKQQNDVPSSDPSEFDEALHKNGYRVSICFSSTIELLAVPLICKNA